MGIEPGGGRRRLLVKSPFAAETEVPIFRVAAVPHSPPRLASPSHSKSGNLPILTQHDLTGGFRIYEFKIGLTVGYWRYGGTE